MEQIRIVLNLKRSYLVKEMDSLRNMQYYDFYHKLLLMEYFKNIAVIFSSELSKGQIFHGSKMV